LTTLTQIGLKKIRPFLVVFVPIDRYFVPIDRYFVPIDRYFVPIDPMKALHSKAFRPSKKRKKEKKKKRKAIFHEKQPYALAKARTF
jgi:hypothetical protein